MRATFGHSTLREWGSLSHRARAAAKQQRVCALFEEIQLAIHEGDGLTIDDLMTELAEATAQDHRAELLGDN